MSFEYFTLGPLELDQKSGSKFLEKGVCSLDNVEVF